MIPTQKDKETAERAWTLYPALEPPFDPIVGTALWASRVKMGDVVATKFVLRVVTIPTAEATLA